MFHRNCFQISLLNFRSSTETVSREDPQIDFATETFFALERGGGGGVHKNVSKILATINFSSGEIDGKFLSVWKNFIGNINLNQTSRLNLDKLASARTFLIADRHRSHKLWANSPGPRPYFTRRLHHGANTF